MTLALQNPFGCLSALLLLSSASGCTLYQPILPSAPLVRQKGEVEVSGNMRVPAIEGSVGYSPIQHLQVAARGHIVSASKAPDSTYSFTRNRQYEAGIGYYTTLTQPRLRFSLLGGAGQGRGRVYGSQGFGGLPSGFPVSGNGEVKKPDWRGSYHKYFGEVSIAHFDTSTRGNQRIMGGTVRATWVKFARLTLNEVSVDEPSMVYFEPSWFWRVGSTWLQGQASVGISVPCRKMKEEHKYVLADGSVLLGLGVIIVPTELYRRIRNK